MCSLLLGLPGMAGWEAGTDLCGVRALGSALSIRGMGLPAAVSLMALVWGNSTCLDLGTFRGEKKAPMFPWKMGYVHHWWIWLDWIDWVGCRLAHAAFRLSIFVSGCNALIPWWKLVASSSDFLLPSSLAILPNSPTPSKAIWVISSKQPSTPRVIAQFDPGSVRNKLQIETAMAVEATQEGWHEVKISRAGELVGCTSRDFVLQSRKMIRWM